MQRLSKYDVVVVGSGFGGSLLAMVARRLGRSVLLLEKSRHPRFAIGESSTPLANLMLEELSARYELPCLKPFCKWGSWQHAYPEVACGLKRGFSFFHHDLLRPMPVMKDRDRQLLVAASPHDAIADTHWYRSEFDHELVKQAQGLGVEYRDKAELSGIREVEDGVVIAGCGMQIHAGLLVDATGPRGFLHRVLGMGELPLPEYPETAAVFAHFKGVRRLDRCEGDPPFPPDDAAVHHVFERGWIWVLRFNNEVTSAGVAYAGKPPKWEYLLDRIPDLGRQFASAERITEWQSVLHLPFRSAHVAGRHWALLSSAAGFVDPLLSTGFPLTLLGVEGLAGVLEGRQSLAEYALVTEGNLLAAADLIGALYANLGNFSVFRALTLLYFAAVSFSESAWRLGKRDLAASFLLREDPRVGPTIRDLLRRSRERLTPEQSAGLIADILDTIAPFDVAGLRNARRCNWFPVDAEDLFRASHLVHSTRAEIEQMLDRGGFFPSSETV